MIKNLKSVHFSGPPESSPGLSARTTAWQGWVRAEASIIPSVADLLRQGGVVIYPTETVYGLGCLADDAPAVERIAAIKGSETSSSFLILVHEFDQILNYAKSIPEAARDLAARFWPGPLTLILPALSILPRRIIGPTGGVALRVSPHPWTSALMQELGMGLISTSANRHGYPPPVSLIELDQQVGDQADAVIDGGTLSGIPSTVLDLCGEKPVLVREGAIGREEIEGEVGRIDVA